MSANLSLLEIFQRTLKFLQLYAPDDPKATQALQAVYEALSQQLDFSGTLDIDVFQSRGRFQLLANGQLMDGPPQAVMALAQVFMDRRIHRISFERGVDEEELRILFFLLQLKPQRLVELGGPGTFADEMPNILLNEGVTLSGVPGMGYAVHPVLSPPQQISPLISQKMPPTVPLPMLVTPPSVPVFNTIPLANTPLPTSMLTRPLPPDLDPSILEPSPSPKKIPQSDHQPLLSATETLRAMFGEPLHESEESQVEEALLPPTEALLAFEVEAKQEGTPEPALEPPPPPPSLKERLVGLFAPIAETAQAMPPRAAAPWTLDQLECLRRSELRFADLSILQGACERMELNREDTSLLRDQLRQALWSLPPSSQGAILLGIPVFPPGEQALQRAMDYLAPELLAQTVAEVELRLRPPRPQLALLVATLLYCVKDREMSLEALRGRLQFEGWDIVDLESLYDDIRWECQGTDTKLNNAIKDEGLLELESSQIGSLCRQALRGGRLDTLKTFWKTLEEALWGKSPAKKRKAAEVFADLTECARDPGLPPGMETQLRELLSKHLAIDTDLEALSWSCQGIESLVAQALTVPDLAYAVNQVQAILDLTVSSSSKAGGAKISSAIHDLYLRISGARNVNALLPLMYQKQAEPIAAQLATLLGLLGQPAARHLVFCLGHEEDRNKRYKLLDAIACIGPKAVLPLREALAAPEWYLVRNVIALLGDIGESSAFEDVALTLAHKDARVRRMAAKALGQIDASRAVPLLLEALPNADPNSSLELIHQLAEMKDARAVGPLVALLQDGKAAGSDPEKFRQSVLEALGVLGAIGSPDVVPVLSELFKKKGFLGRMEPLPLRIAAARALAAIGTREAREAMARAMETETKDDVKTILRQNLVGN